MTAMPRRATLVRRILYTAWAMATVVLLFCVVLLLMVLYQRRASVPASPNRQAPAALAEPGTELAPTKEVTVFFADAAERRLVGKPYSIESSDYTVENCRKALEVLFRGPENPLHPVVPPSSKPVRALYLLENGELVVDLSIELEVELKKRSSASLEALMVYGIVNTVSQPDIKGDKEPAVAQVRFLIEGALPRESFPAHVDLSQPVVADPRWVANTAE